MREKKMLCIEPGDGWRVVELQVKNENIVSRKNFS